MIDTERRKELLEMQEYYDCLDDDEWEEEKPSFERWWASLTVEEIEFLEEENEKFNNFVSSTSKEIVDLINKRDETSER